jgi:hypothetical protein
MLTACEQSELKMAHKSKFETDLRAAFERTTLPEDLDLALSLIRGEADPLQVPAAQRLNEQCYNPPGRHYLTMTALDALLGTCGVEYIGEVHMTDGPPMEYLNTGDSYAPTLVWFRNSRRFHVRCWADCVKYAERNK